MGRMTVGPNANLYNLKPFLAERKSEVEGNDNLIRVDEIKRPKSFIEKVGVVVKDPGASDALFKWMNQLAALVQEIQPSATWGKVESLFGKARAASTPFYLLKTITDVVHLNKESTGRKIAKAWLELVQAASINWNVWTSLLFERSDKIVGHVGTFAGLGSDVIQLVDLGVDLQKTGENISGDSYAPQDVVSRLKQERGIQWAKIAAVVASIASGVFAILTLALGVSPIPAVALLAIALAGTTIKVGTTFYEKTRETDLFELPETELGAF